MKLKFKALALVAAMIAAPAFAADYQTDLVSAPVDVAGEAATAYTTNYLSAGNAATDPFTTNVALIQQDGIDANIAVIDQSGGGAGNFAAIAQTGGVVAGVAYVFQGASSNNFAFIKQ
jgi:hypothetical protein